MNSHFGLTVRLKTENNKKENQAPVTVIEKRRCSVRLISTARHASERSRK